MNPKTIKSVHGRTITTAVDDGFTLKFVDVVHFFLGYNNTASSQERSKHN